MLFEITSEKFDTYIAKNRVWVVNRFFNGYLNTVSQLRSSFERTPGGAFHHQFKINQLKLELNFDNSLVFYAVITFIVSTFVEMGLMVSRISKRMHFITRKG